MMLRRCKSENDVKIFNINKWSMDEGLNVSINDFDFFKLLGRGAYGGVWLVKKKKVKDLYAMKVIDIQQQVIFFIKKS